MTSVDTFNGIEDSGNRRSAAWRILFQLEARLSTVFEDRLKKSLGLTPAEYYILMNLWEASGQAMRMGHLAAAMSYSPSRVSYLVTQLETKGLVNHKVSIGDARGVDAVLTELGTEKALEASRIQQEVLREIIVGNLKESEIETAVRFLNGLNLKKEQN